MPGLPPGGLSPVSAFDIQGRHEPARPPAISAPMIDPTTGEIASLVRSRPIADAFAIEAVRVRRASGAAVQDLGLELDDLRHVEDGIEQLALSRLTAAFQPGEACGALRLEGVEVAVDDADGSQMNLVVTFRALLEPGAPVRRQMIPL